VSAFLYWGLYLQGSNLEKIFRTSRSKNSVVWSLVVVAILDIPLMLILFLGSQEPVFFLVILGVIFSLNGLLLSLGFLGGRMSY